MPVRFGKLTETRRDAWCVMAGHAFGGRREKRKHGRSDEAWKQCPSQNAASAERAEQGCGAKRSEDRAQSVHCAFEAECAARLARSDRIREQRVARRPTAAPPNPSQRPQQQDRRPCLREGVAERREA